ncbi:uncharacterized protein PHACADRAFT_249027 [Phanerochaete carnosa HHB-10118-sp]|uniref:Uncharacterized protein n=1 Tax=Phanerochaete carnosa (strain HHB-10118-sp) TaxID=650164 RepID=K5V817_PHACS|nr:uncharacterized protein PHACADRAFT_249027 [Phanerochaete carnosa HHB-10118-sp]EKM58911.1 hypothetical protein PHACADRAFT_249027 [Phanerochaete carnosa HHB-10118-sp]
MRMFRRPRPPSASHEIYTSSLQMLNVGHALWFPEPHHSGEPQIGDVGFIREGALVRLFNLDTSAPEKKVTHWDDYPPFEVTPPLPKGALKTYSAPRVLFPGHHCSHGVESKEIHTSADA